MYRLIERDCDIYEYELYGFETLEEAKSKVYDILYTHKLEYVVGDNADPIVTIEKEDENGGVYRIDYICKFTGLRRIKEFEVTNSPSYYSK